MTIGPKKQEGRRQGEPAKAHDHFLKSFFFLLIGILIAAGDSFPRRGKADWERFGGEDVQYEAGFGFFPGGAGQPVFTTGNDQFLLTHEGQAQGLAAGSPAIGRKYIGLDGHHRAGKRLIPCVWKKNPSSETWVRKRPPL